MEIIEFLDYSSLGHSHFLLAGLAVLILGNYLRSRLLSILSLGLLIYDFFTISGHGSSDILHYSIDLILISILAFIASAFNKKSFKISYLPLALLACLLIHELYQQVLPQDKGTQEFTLSQDNELFLLFNSSEERKTWINDNKGVYKINFPLFTPVDLESELDDFVGVDLSDDTDPMLAIGSIEKDPRVKYIEGNEILKLEPPINSTIRSGSSSSSSTTDPLSGQQWSLSGIHQEKYYDMIRNRMSSQTDNNTLLAILDTGIDSDHEDLVENYYSIKKEHDSDPRGHGTHCAGIAAAVTGNNIGIASLLPPKAPVKVSSVKVLNSFGIGTQEQIIKGIIEAVDNGASVISLSLGAPTNKSKEKAYSEAIDYALNHKVVVVVAAGNSSSDASKYSPANTKGVITVSSINAKNKRSSFANHLENIDMGIYAPGENILSCLPNDSYKSQSGTSMAAPYVAGFAALLKHFDPSMTSRDMHELLVSTADINQEGQSIMNAEKAFESFIRAETTVQ